MGRLVVVANRVPPAVPLRRPGERRAHALGGLVTAVRPAVENRDSMWFGWSGVSSSGDAKPQVTQVGNLQLVTMDLSRTEVNRYYAGFSNEALWPLLHSFPERVRLDPADFETYRKVNLKFAEALYPLVRPDDTLWVHDFHLFLLGRMLRDMGWNSKIGFFLHVPFPPPEIFTMLPWQRQILESLLAYDLIGVHAQRYADNLMDCFVSELAGERDGGAFVSDEGRVHVGAHPLGIDPQAFREWAQRDEDREPIRLLRSIPPSQKVILGVDRLDYTKGIPERLSAFERLLETYPDMRERVTMIQISAPSRSEMPLYVEEKARVEQLVGKINGRFSTPDWTPVRYLYRAYAQDELAVIFRRTAVCLVTPLRDGMNLVAKEYVASQGDDPGVVVLSRFCGAAETMTEAIIVNPYDLDGTAKGIYDALNMPKDERVQRWKGLYEDISRRTSTAWCDAFLEHLDRLQPRPEPAPV